MFERFTKQARDALALAQQEAAALGHDAIDTEHILLGVLAEGEVIEGLSLGSAREAIVRLTGPRGVRPVGDAEALATIGIDLDSITAAVEAAFGEGALDRAVAPNRRRLGGGAPFTPKAKKALELSLREALSRGDDHIGTEHLVLGLVRMKEGVAYEIIELNRLRPGA
jgi:ATP-dependent Clp protease ATP-binding subunit ClpA